jgi:hypothetical protein
MIESSSESSVLGAYVTFGIPYNGTVKEISLPLLSAATPITDCDISRGVQFPIAITIDTAVRKISQIILHQAQS